MCDRGLSNGESIVIITIIDISFISPFSLIVILKKKSKKRALWNSFGFNLIKGHEFLTRSLRSSYSGAPRAREARMWAEPHS